MGAPGVSPLIDSTTVKISVAAVSEHCAYFVTKWLYFTIFYKFWAPISQKLKNHNEWFFICFRTLELLGTKTQYGHFRGGDGERDRSACQKLEKKTKTDANYCNTI